MGLTERGARWGRGGGGVSRETPKAGQNGNREAGWQHTTPTAHYVLDAIRSTLPRGWVPLRSNGELLSARASTNLKTRAPGPMFHVKQHVLRAETDGAVEQHCPQHRLKETISPWLPSLGARDQRSLSAAKSLECSSCARRIGTSPASVVGKSCDGGIRIGAGPGGQALVDAGMVLQARVSHVNVSRPHPRGVERGL